MAYVGNPIDTQNTFQSLVGKRFNGDGSTTAFTLDVAPSSTLDLEVFVGNVRQDPNSAYTVSGTTLTFTGAPPSGTNNVYVVHQAKSVGTIDLPEGALVDLNGGSDKLVLDADADTTISADTDDQVDIKVGGSDIATLTSSALTLKNSATADNSTFTVNLQTAEADIAADDVLAKINFQAPNEGTGTDANLIAASIQATSEGDFSSSSNATKLEFMTGASEAATTKMSISSGGNVAFNSGFGSVTTVYGCRVWCNLDGTGTVSIQGSGNVSSITDGGTGKYTVTFANAMPDTNYSTSALSLSTSSLFPHADGEGSTTAIVIQAREVNDSPVDSVMTMAVFR
jgi:hypothetical protein